MADKGVGKAVKVSHPQENCFPGRFFVESVDTVDDILDRLSASAHSITRQFVAHVGSKVVEPGAIHVRMLSGINRGRAILVNNYAARRSYITRRGCKGGSSVRKIIP